MSVTIKANPSCLTGASYLLGMYLRGLERPQRVAGLEDTSMHCLALLIAAIRLSTIPATINVCFFAS